VNYAQLKTEGDSSLLQVFAGITRGIRQAQ